LRSEQTTTASTAFEHEEEVKGNIILDVVIAESTLVLEPFPHQKRQFSVANLFKNREGRLLLSGENKTLLIGRYTFLVLNIVF
jgi:hypothetical protein